MEDNGNKSGKETPKESLEELAQRTKQTEKELEELKQRILTLQKEIRRRLKE